MKSVDNLIISEAYGDAAFIFPSEAAAAGCRREYLRSGSAKAVRNDRFISWDRFKEQITLHNRSERPLNSVLRRLFAVAMVQRNSREQVFTSLIPPEYRNQASAFTDSVMRVLPELEKLVRRFDEAEIPESWAADYRKLHREYTVFMRDNGLFEPSWELPELRSLTGDFFIICPEIIEDYPEFEHLLRQAGCRVLNADDCGTPVLRQFDNSVIETDTVLNEIAALLDAGIHHSEIAVTAADDETADLLLARARLRGIRLIRRSGKPLGEYPAGRLPSLLRGCRGSGYSLESMKNLLLNRAFIWKEADTAAALIRFGIENRCLKNTSAGPDGDVWGNRLRSVKTADTEKRREITSFYRKLRAGIEKVCGCRNFAELSRELQIFLAGFLETDAGVWGGECEQVFQRTREVLSGLRETVESLEGFTVDDPLGLWIDLLSEKIYVPQQKETGIPVYSYRVSALINPANHFVIGLTNDASTVNSQSFAFLSDARRRELDAPELNMTRDFINIYAQSGRDVRFSSAAETPSGTALPPSFFIEKGGVESSGPVDFSDIGSLDPLIGEQLWWGRACSSGISGAGILPVLSESQLAGFHYAEATFMADNGFDATSQAFPAAVNEQCLLPALCDDDGFFRVSATALDRWSSCRFNSFLADVLEITEEEYLLRAEEPWTAGSIMHDILLEFFTVLKESGRAFRAADGLQSYRDLIGVSADKVFNEWERSGNYFFGPAWDALKRRVLNDLSFFPEAEAKVYDGLIPLLLEQWLDFRLEEQKIRGLGRVDRISAGVDGEPDRVVIVDYKRSWQKQTKSRFIRTDENGDLMQPEKGYQLPFYILLALSNKLSVAGTSYYGISEASHFPVTGEYGVLNEDETGELCELTMNEILRMAESCRGGDYTAAERCDGCAYRSICRKRYNLRWDNE